MTFFFFTVDLHNPKPPDSALKRRAKPRDGTALRNKVLRPPFNSKAGETWGALEFPRYRPLSLKGWQCQPLPLPPFQAWGSVGAHFHTPSMCKGYHQEVAHTRWAIKAINQKSEKWLQSEDGFECVPNWRIWMKTMVFKGFHRTLEAVDRSSALIVRVKSHGDLCPTSVLPKIRVGLDHHFGIFLGRHQILPISKPPWSVSSPRFLLVKSALDEGTQEHPDQHGKKMKKAKKQSLVSDTCSPLMNGKNIENPVGFP